MNSDGTGEFNKHPELCNSSYGNIKDCYIPSYAEKLLFERWIIRKTV